jgi:hypothetical protein
LRYNIAASAASAAPDPVAALVNDIETLHAVTESVTATHPIYVMSSTRAMTAQIRSAHGLGPLTVLGSPGLTGSNIMLAVTPNNIASILEGVPEIVTARHGAPTMSTAPATGDSVKSIWQTDCIAILLRFPVTWVARSAPGVAWLTAGNW